MSKNITSYLISGILLTYFGLKDKDFLVWYNGVALVLGITAFMGAYLEYRKEAAKPKK